MRTLNQITDEDYSSICRGIPFTRLASSTLHGTTLHTAISHPLSKEQVADFFSRLYRTLTGNSICVVKAGEDYRLVQGNGHPKQRTEIHISPGITIPLFHPTQYNLELVRGKLEVIYPLAVELSS